MSRADFAALRAALRRVHDAHAQPNDWPADDMAVVDADMGLELYSREVTVTWGSYGWTREARPLAPWATTDRSPEIGEHGTHTHTVTPRGFAPGDVVYVEFTLDRTHPVVTAILEFPGT